MSTRKLIYVPSEKIWESVKKAAKDDGRSASNYLIQLHRVNIEMWRGGLSELKEDGEEFTVIACEGEYYKEQQT